MPIELALYVPPDAEAHDAYMTVADLRQVLDGLPAGAVVLTYDDESGEFQPYPWPLRRQVRGYGLFPSDAGFTYVDLVRFDDPTQPDAIQEFEGIVL